MNLLTQEEAARALGCSTSTVERLRRSGALPYLPGRPVLVELADVLALIERKSRRPTAPTGVAVAADRGRLAAISRTAGVAAGMTKATRRARGATTATAVRPSSTD